MGKLNDIEQKLLSGSTASQLKKEGYAKSSVTYVDRKLKKAEPVSTPTPSVNDELQQLRYQKELVKIKKEIADIEDSKENIPDRMAVLDSRLTALESWCDSDLVDAIGDCIWSAWRAADRSEEDATEAALRRKAKLKRKT